MRELRFSQLAGPAVIRGAAPRSADRDLEWCSRGVERPQRRTRNSSSLPTPDSAVCHSCPDIAARAAPARGNASRRDPLQGIASLE
jgi:hypothetical protein